MSLVELNGREAWKGVLNIEGAHPLHGRAGMSMEGWVWILKGWDEYVRVGMSMEGRMGMNIEGWGWAWKGGNKYERVGMSMEGWG